MALEQVFEYPRTLAKLRGGPLGWLLENFCDWLLKRGFTRCTVRRHLCYVSHLNTWLAEEGWRWTGQLSAKDVGNFHTSYRLWCRNRGPLEKHLREVRYSISRFCEFLKVKGIFDPMVSSPLYQPLLEGYLAWMRDHQHADEGTLKGHRHKVQQFLEWLGSAATAEGLSDLSANSIESFFLDYASDKGHATRRLMRSALRTFLRFCLYEGYIPHHLDHAVPPLRTYKLARVPRGLSERQAQTVLQAVDRYTKVGLRDYAILTLLHTYGVRGGQVRALQLDDIHWSHDQILFRAMKGGKDSLLPLTPEVGESLIDYLRNARPSSSFREVFMTSRAPYHPMWNSSVLSSLVQRHILTAGINPPNKGSHVFRHAFATRMVADGHPFKAVADVLGHRYLSSTFIYTKVDFNALSQVALEWPGEVGS
ncbi:MAG: site-specific integrase [Planctomycetota bacterium]|nr:site-specific integrase [Planctomycetota bacterium]